MVLAGIGAVVCLLTVSFGLSACYYLRERSTSRLVLRSTAETNQIRLLLAHVTDAETGQRGFLLTGSSQYLEPYQQAAA